MEEVLTLPRTVPGCEGEENHYRSLPLAPRPLLLQEKGAVSSLARTQAEVEVSSWLSSGSQHSPGKAAALQCSSALVLQAHQALPMQRVQDHLGEAAVEPSSRPLPLRAPSPVPAAEVAEGLAWETRRGCCLVRQEPHYLSVILNVQVVGVERSGKTLAVQAWRGTTEKGLAASRLRALFALQHPLGAFRGDRVGLVPRTVAPRRHDRSAARCSP